MRRKAIRCIGCLYSVGLGLKRIKRFAGYSTTTSSVYLNKIGMLSATNMATRRAEEYNRRKAKAGLDSVDYQKIDDSVFYGPVYDARIRAILAKRSRDARRRANPERHNAYNRKYLPKLMARARAMPRLPSWMVARAIRGRITSAMRKHGTSKSQRTINLLGCSYQFFRKYLEVRFKDGMSWQNYGKWHIDHIIPCASFDLTKKSEQAKCFHYTNLQPLWAIDNITKQDKIEEQMTLDMVCPR